MRKTFWIVALLSGLGALGVLAVRHFHAGATPEKPSDSSVATGPPAAGAKRPVTALGRLEPADGIIDISGTPGDRVLDLSVKVGDQVQQGDELARLESYKLYEAQWELAQTQLDEARSRQGAEERYAAALQKEAQLAEQQVDLERLEVEAQEQKMEALRAARDAADDDLRRLEACYNADRSGDEPPVVSRQQLEHQRVATEKARKDLSSAEALLKKLHDSVTLGEAQAQAKLETAEANRARIPSTVQLASLEKGVELARKRVETAILRAPCNGEILKVSLSRGEILAQQPILQMADTSRMVAVAEIYEDDALSVEVGETATVKCPALGEPLQGKVIHVGTLVARKTVVSLTPTDSADSRVVEARVLLDAGERARKLINLQVTVFILGQQPPSGGKPVAAAR